MSGNTRLLSANCPSDIAVAVDLLRADQVVGLPTETVYGLAANALSITAVQAIFTAKQRPADNPLIVHVTGAIQAARLTTQISELAQTLMAEFWPGPLTLVLPKSPLVPDVVTAGRADVGLRSPAHPAFQQVLRRCGFPLAAPSANPAGQPSPTTATHVLAELNGVIPAVLDGGPSQVGVESTVLALTGTTPRLLRPGGVTVEQIQSITGQIIIDPAITEQVAPGVAPAAPGMKYRHYAPATPVAIFQGTAPQALAYLARHATERIGVMGFDDDAELFRNVPFIAYGASQDGKAQARNLFAALHKLDGLGADRIIAFAPPTHTGVSLAVHNRLNKAAAFTTISGS